MHHHKTQRTTTSGTGLACLLSSHVSFVLGFLPSLCLLAAPLEKIFGILLKVSDIGFLCSTCSFAKMREVTSRLPPWIDAAAAQLVICHIYLNNHPNAWGLNHAASVHLCICSQVDLETQQPARLGWLAPGECSHPLIHSWSHKWGK